MTNMRKKNHLPLFRDDLSTFDDFFQSTEKPIATNRLTAIIKKKGRRIFFQATHDDKRLNTLKSYAIVSEDQNTYTLLIDHYNWHTYTATFFKADVLEDPNLLPDIEEKLRNHPDYFGL